MFTNRMFLNAAPLGAGAGSGTQTIVTLSSDQQNLDISTLFESSLWSSSTTKLLIIPSGITVSSSNPANPALYTGTGHGGTLTINNAGDILAAGGTASSGNGGNAFSADETNVVLNNTGIIKAGGGGGGDGGLGGGGYYTQTVNRDPSSGYHTTGGNPNQNGTPHYCILWYGGRSYVAWGNTAAVTSTSGNIGSVSGTPSTFNLGGWTYHRGSLFYAMANDSYKYFKVYRYQISTVNTTGGAGGTGGVGQGYNQAATTGSAGSAGGTNAGTGGTGGTGGAWGTAGSTGSTGTAGNNGAGVAGSTGGTAGTAVVNPSNVTVNNSGTIVG